MPRTKRPARIVEKRAEDDEAWKKLSKQVVEMKKKVDSRAIMELRNVELAFKILLESISTENLQKTVGQLKTEVHVTETSTTSCRSASQDDGYLTENSSQGSGDRHVKKTFLAPPSRARPRRSRSADASSRSVRGGGARQSRSRSVYRTPAYNKNAPLNYPPITPKVDPRTPLAMIRQPRQGEMVLSMSGSPLMVPTNARDQATCNFQLRDGTTLSMQPQQLRASQVHIPFSLLDGKVLDQLRTLKDNLDKVVRLGEKAIQD